MIVQRERLDEGSPGVRSGRLCVLYASAEQPPKGVNEFFPEFWRSFRWGCRWPARDPKSGSGGN